MKKNTYDVPAYKVGLVLIEGEQNIEHSKEDYELAIKTQREIVVPFEDVDGLTVREVQSVLKTKEIYLCFYYRFQSEILKNRGMVQNEAGIFKVGIHIAGFSEETLEKPIDEVVENTLEDMYNTLEPEQKQFAHCFFERYQDKSYKKTKKRIKRLENKKNKNNIRNR